MEDRTGWPVFFNTLESQGLTYNAIMILAREKGGTRFTVPRAVTDDHWLVKLIGRTSAEAFVYHHGGISLDFPLGPLSDRHQRWEAMRRLDREGHSYNKIAGDMGVNRRTVIRQVKGVLQADPEQPDMFADHHPRPRP